MPIATDAPIVIGGLIGFGAVFVVLGYLVRCWWWLLLADIVAIAALATTAVVWPRGDELATGALIALLLIPAALAGILTGLGVAIRSIVRPHQR